MAQRRKPVASGRLQKLLIDITVAEPYEVADGITIHPLTKKRSESLANAQSAIAITNSLMQQALGRSASPRPRYPAPPEPPVPTEKNAAPEVVRAYEESQLAYDKAVQNWRDLVEEWERLVQLWEAEIDRNDTTLNGLADRMRRESDDYTKALFGAAYQDVIDYFDEQPVQLWNAFAEDIKVEFGVTARPEQVPDDGTCPNCGEVEDEEQAGKALEPST